MSEAMGDLQKWEQDKSLYLFTSLTAGSSHIVSATNRMDTILRNARIPFTYIDTASNDSAKMLFQRRGRAKKLPFLVKEGFVLGDLEQVEEWNEFGELKEAIGPVEAKDTSITTTPAKASTAPAPIPGAVPTPTTTQPLSESSSPPAPIPGASPLPPSTMSALQAAARETAALAKARQTVAAAPPPPVLPVTEPKEPAPTPVPELTTAAAAATSEEEKRAVNMSPLSATASTYSVATSHTAGHISPVPFVPEHFEPPPTTHRGSSVSLASNEEIKEVERRETIPEVDEDECEEEKKGIDEVTTGVEAVKLDGEAKSEENPAGDAKETS